VTAPSRRHAPISFSARTASRAVWATTSAAPERRPNVSVSGRLELVDLRKARFRIRDAVGNDVHLERVPNADDAARHLGELVTATGDAMLGTRGQVASLIGARVEPTGLPVWTPPTLADVDFGSAAPSTEGIDGVDDDEVAAFLALIRE
jgi:hypothetical protein